MDDNMLYDQTGTDGIEHYVGEVVNTLPARQGGLSARLEQRACNAMYRNARLQAEHEKCRMLLTNAAMGHTAMLSNAENYLSKVAPNCQVRCKQLVDAYVEEAAKRIKSW